MAQEEQSTTPSAAELQDLLTEEDVSELRESAKELFSELVEEDINHAVSIAEGALSSPEQYIRFKAALSYLDTILIKDPEAALPLYEKAFSDESIEVRNTALVWFLNATLREELDLDEAFPVLEAAQEQGFAFGVIEICDEDGEDEVV